ncbi:MAG: KamA family radical SAM protein [Bacteriovoracaceae bacterium]|nr:KamA family radical SAM protein [Bacteriovoracaceae bacterium]
MNSPASWQTELTEAFRSSESLAAFLETSLPTLNQYPVLIPKKLAQMIKNQGLNGVLARQFLPDSQESSLDGFIDPIGDKTHIKTSQLIHRYHNRALLIPTTVCPVHCRYCFRKNELQSDGPFAQDREKTLNYLQAHSEIEEVIFTGGDPLILSDEKIQGWLEALSTIEHIKFIRFHSRVPVILPSRLTRELSNLFESFHKRFKIVLSVHTNHKDEWSEEAKQATSEFRPKGMKWISQVVLLKGINNDAEVLLELFRFLANLDISAYYLHHPDQVKGGMHFWLSLEEGRMLWGQLHNRLPGWMLPQYVIDIPGGEGKVQAFNPEGHRFSGMLLNRSGQLKAIARPSFQASDSSTLS